MRRESKSKRILQLQSLLAHEQEPGIWDTVVCQTCHSDLCRKGKCVICIKREMAGVAK